MHFFDGFRTSHEIQKIHTVPEEELKKLIDEDALYEFKHKGLNPEHPVMRSTVTNPDMYFQSKEASNIWYDRLPQIVDEYMQQINTLTGRNYKLLLRCRRCRRYLNRHGFRYGCCSGNGRYIE